MTAIALTVRSIYLFELQKTPAPLFPWVFINSDMFASVQWARSIALGDWLSLHPPHHFPTWMSDIASFEQWRSWWGHPATLTRAPLYESILGISFFLFGESPWPLYIGQTILGVVQVLAIFYAGTFFVGRRWALVVSAIAALYSPFIYQQGTLVRDAISVPAHTILFCLFLRSRQINTTFAWSISAMVAGGVTLLRESSLGFFILHLAMLVWRNKGDRRNLVKFATWSLIVYASALSPLIYRNVRLGLAPLHTTDYLPVNMLIAWSPDSQPIGLSIPASMGRVLHETQGQLKPVLRRLLDFYTDHPLKLLSIFLTKVRGFVDPFEVPNNDNYYYMRSLSPVLQWTLTYRFVSPLGLLGIFLAGCQLRRTWPLFVYLALSATGVFNVCVISRYRLDSVGPFLLLSGWSLRLLFRKETPHQKRLAVALAAGIIGAVLPLVSPLSPTQKAEMKFRNVEFSLAETIFLKHHSPMRAAEELRRWRHARARVAGASDETSSLALRELKYRIMEIEQKVSGESENIPSEMWARLEEAVESCDPSSGCHWLAARIYRKANLAEQGKKHQALAQSIQPSP